MLGAPLGAWTGWGKSDFESLAFRPIVPLNGAGGVGSTSWADESAVQRHIPTTSASSRGATLLIVFLRLSSNDGWGLVGPKHGPPTRPRSPPDSGATTGRPRPGRRPQARASALSWNGLSVTRVA